jgi:chromosome segregation ATPase
MPGVVACFRSVGYSFAAVLLLLLPSGCATTQYAAAQQQLAAAAAERAQFAQATELALAKQQVRLLLLRTQYDSVAAQLTARTAQLQTERAVRANLEAAYDKLAHAPAPTRRTADPSAAELKATRELLRRQTTTLEGSVRTSRDSVALQTQRLQQTKAVVRALEQTVADRDRSIADLRQKLTVALNPQGMNVKFQNGKMLVTLPDQPLKKLVKQLME